MKGLCKKRLSSAVAYFCFSVTIFKTSVGNPVPASEDTILVSSLPFSEKIRNPCALVDASRLHRGALNQVDSAQARRTVINEMKAKAILLKDSSETILRTNVLSDCSTLELPYVATIPSAVNISDATSRLNILRDFYTSLLNHTAHVYFITEQLQRYHEDHTCYIPDLGDNARTLATQMRELMCVVRLSTISLEPNEGDDNDDSFSESTSMILNEELIDQPVCSRRSVRDCQTILSTVTLLREFSTFLQGPSFMDEETPTS